MTNLKNWLNKRSLLVVVLLLILPTVMALFRSGFYGASDEVHIAWLHEFHASVVSGKFPPRYAPNLSFSFGYPLFNFVFPLPFYIGELFVLLGFSYIASIKGVFLIATLLATVGMYLLIREFAKDKYALLGALMYSYAPYRATNLYVRGAIGEIVAFGLFPFVLLFVYRQLASNKLDKNSIALGGVAIGFLILSHNIASYMFLPFVILFALIFAFFAKAKLISLLGVALQFVLGLVVSAFFWVPALSEAHLVKYGTVFNYLDHYPTLRQLATPYFGYGASVPGPYDGMSFFVGLAYLAMLLIVLWVVVSKWTSLPPVDKALSLWILVSTGVVVFLMNHRSSFLWETIPYLKYFQFPWRFLMVLTLAIPLGVSLLSKLKGVKLLYLGLLLLAVSSVFYFRPQDFQDFDDGHYLAIYIPNKDTIDIYAKNQEQYLLLPVDTSLRPSVLHDRFFGEYDDGEIIIENDYDASLKFTLDRETTINYSKYNFPGWYANLDGEEVAITSGVPYGQIAITVPPGEHELYVYYKESGYKLFLDILSLGTILGLGITAIKNRHV